MKNYKPAAVKLPALAQLCKLIPSHLTASLAKKHGIDKQARTFSAWSHVVIFWKTLHHLENSLPGGFGLRYKGLPRRFKKPVCAIDSSTIALLANCMSWAKHRRRKAAAKLHLRLNLQTFLGHNREAIRWQLWSALLLYVLMRWQGQAAGWTHRFSRLLAMTRGVVWDRIDLAALLKYHGTAGGGWRMRSCCEGTYLSGFSP